MAQPLLVLRPGQASTELKLMGQPQPSTQSGDSQKSAIVNARNNNFLDEVAAAQARYCRAIAAAAHAGVSAELMSRRPDAHGFRVRPARGADSRFARRVRQKRAVQHKPDCNVCPPAALLVGIEPNPGPIIEEVQDGSMVVAPRRSHIVKSSGGKKYHAEVTFDPTYENVKRVVRKYIVPRVEKASEHLLGEALLRGGRTIEQARKDFSRDRAYEDEYVSHHPEMRAEMLRLRAAKKLIGDKSKACPSSERALKPAVAIIKREEKRLSQRAPAKKMLVGIETNPGPNPRRQRRGKKQGKKRKGGKKRGSRLPTTVTKQRSTSNSFGSAVTLERKMQFKTVTMPINAADINLKSSIGLNSDGITYFGTNATTGSNSGTSTYNMQLHPIVNTHNDPNDFANQAAMFGRDVAAEATNYVYYRIPKFKVEYISQLTNMTSAVTSVPNIGLCWSGDPLNFIGASLFTSDPWGSSWQDLQSTATSVTGSLLPEKGKPLALTVDVAKYYKARGIPQPWLNLLEVIPAGGVTNGDRSLYRQEFQGVLSVTTNGRLPDAFRGLTLGSLRITGDIQFAEHSNAGQMTLINPFLGGASMGTTPGGAAPELMGNTTSGTSTLAAPFDATNSPNVFQKTTPQVGIPNTSVIRLGKQALADGIWRLRLTATNAAGTITVGFSVSAAGVGTGQYSSFSISSSSAPPYSYQNIFAIYGTGSTSNYVDITVSGPTTMTAGDVQLDVLKISGSSTSLPTVAKKLPTIHELWGTEVQEDDESPIHVEEEYRQRLLAPLGVSTSSPPVAAYAAKLSNLKKLLADAQL